MYTVLSPLNLNYQNHKEASSLLEKFDILGLYVLSAWRPEALYFGHFLEVSWHEAYVWLAIMQQIASAKELVQSVGSLILTSYNFWILLCSDFSLSQRASGTFLHWWWWITRGTAFLIWIKYWPDKQAQFCKQILVFLYECFTSD